MILCVAFGSGDVRQVKRNSSAEVCRAALEEGGLSVNCGGYLPGHLEAAVQNGTVSEEVLDAALTRTWEASISLGNFDTPNEQCAASHTHTRARARAQGLCRSVSSKVVRHFAAHRSLRP